LCAGEIALLNFFGRHLIAKELTTRDVLPQTLSSLAPILP
jgi:hypothetical protein